MKKNILIVVFLFLPFIAINAQTSIYTAFSQEYIFNSSTVKADMGSGIKDINSNMRFTAFLNYGLNLHLDVSGVFGFYSGLAIRNIGIIIDDSGYNDMTIEKDNKLKRRSYTLGAPLAFKLGKLSNDLYLFAGGEIEMLFHYKEKYWIDGTKFKSKDWFSKKTERWNPSVFVGVQLPGGFNVKYKYYFNDFLNHGYKDSMYDFTSLAQSSMWYISVGWQIRIKTVKKEFRKEFYQTAMK